jgi:hypothetical protein
MHFSETPVVHRDLKIVGASYAESKQASKWSGQVPTTSDVHLGTHASSGANIDEVFKSVTSSDKKGTGNYHPT